MLRRTFLGAAGAASLRAAGAGPIIDTHTHFYDPTRPQGVPWPSKSETVLYRTVLPDEYIRLTKPLGIAGTVVVEASTWLEDNQWVLDLAARYPVIVGVVGHLQPGGHDFPSHLERFAANPLFRGIRLQNFRGGAEFFADLKRLAAAGLEVDALGGPDMAADLVRVSDRLPELRIVIDHLPFADPEEASARRAFHATLRELGHRPQIYAKVSSVVRRENGTAGLGNQRDAVEELWQVFGEDRVIYGSNWPVSNLQAPYEDVLRVMQQFVAAKGRAAYEKYFWKNSIAAYRWVKR